jgi:hypothetical protein
MTHVPSALRRLTRERAGGACEYCLLPEAMALAPHEPDHVVAQKHGGTTDAANLALSCALCNKHKGSDIASIDPETGEMVPLFNPRIQCWREHFQLVAAQILPVTPIGRATVRLLKAQPSGSAG